MALTCSMVLLVFCSKVKSRQYGLPNYTSFSKLPANYTLKNAKTDGCVVFENLFLTSGEDKWSKFLKISQSGQAANVRIAKYYSKGEKSSSLDLIDLSYDGSIYSINEKDGAYKQYKYLNHYTKKVGRDADFSILDCYILVNKKDVSYDELEKSLTSSNFNDLIDHYRIYQNHIK